MKTTNMKFYDALQLDPAILKRKIAACGTRQEKIYYWTAIAVRSALIVAFAIFMAIKLINKLNRKKEEPAAAPAPTKEEVLLTEIRDLLKEQNNRS